MPSQNKSERAIALTIRSQQLAQPSNAFVRSELPDIFGGTLFCVTWHSNKENRPIDSYVFFEGEKENFFFNASEMARYLNTRTKKTTVAALLSELLTVGGAPSLIAVAITATICYLAVIGKEPPAILSHALTTVLGFYFGSKVSSLGSMNRNITRKVAVPE